MKKGFTLIELLAVIVILAIIALIATPMILGVIENAKKGAVESSANGYIQAIEKQSLTDIINGGAELKDGVYDVPIENVSIKGEPPKAGWLVVEKGEIKDYSFSIDGYIVSKGEKTVKGDKPANKPSNIVKLPAGLTKGTAVYINPETAKICSDYIETNSNTSNKKGCMKWYVYKNNGDSTYQLILDHNTTATVAWSTDENNYATEEESKQGLSVKAQLLADIALWSVSLKENNARLISADEIAEITGADSDSTIKWQAKKPYGLGIETQSSWFYLDGAKSSNKTSYSEFDGWQKQYASDTIKSDYAWLYDRTKTDCSIYGCLNNADSIMTGYGYWTSTPVVDRSNYAWLITRYGRLSFYNVDFAGDFGVRPVIRF